MIKLLFFLWLPLATYASTKKIDDAFRYFFTNGELSARHCGENTARFMRFLADRNIDIHEDIMIVKMNSENNSWSFGNIIALEARWGNVIDQYRHQNYQFHYFSIYQGRVYDFSFATVPTILSFNEYLKRMFIPAKPVEIYGSDFRIRGMGPAYTKEYALEELNDSSFNVYRTDKNGRFQIVNENLRLQDFLTAPL